MPVRGAPDGVAVVMRADVSAADGVVRRKVWRARIFESTAFMLALLAWTVLASLVVGSMRLSFPFIAGFIVVQDFAFTALAVYLVRRAGESFAAIGWVRTGIVREMLLGVALFVPMVVCVALVMGILRAAGLAQPIKPPAYLLPRSGVDYVLAVPLLLVVAVAEETIFRGYLLRRFTQVTHSRALAVILTSAMFALGHAYQGPLGMVAVGTIGVVLALVYLKRGSLAAPIVMHFIQDFIGLIIAPRLFSG